MANTMKRSLLAGAVIIAAIPATPSLAHPHHRTHSVRAPQAMSDTAISSSGLIQGGESPLPPASGGWNTGAFAANGSPIVTEARRYIGGNPTGWSRVWCGRFMNMVLERTGHQGSGSNLARSFTHYGARISAPQVGALAVMARRGGGHVGVVSEVLANGDVKVVSGNHGHRVA